MNRIRRLLVAAATLSAAGLVFASAAGATLSFSRTDYPLPEGTSVGGAEPRSDVVTPAALADLDNDGRLDILVANGYTGNVVVLLNHGDGTFAPAQSFAACGNSSLVSDTIAGQLNPLTDQSPDVAVYCAFEGEVRRLLGDGHGALGPAQAVSPNYATGPLLLGHLSTSPYGDLVYQRVASSYQWACLAPLDGSGGVGTANCFQEDYTNAGHPAVLWHFHNNDCSGGDEMLGFGYQSGDVDWAFQDVEYNGLYTQDPAHPSDPPTGPCESAFHTSGYGHDSGTPYSSNLADPRPSGIAAGDLDGDGHPDVVMADSGGAVHVQPDDHTGSFPSPGAPSSFASAGPISSIALTDFNADGRLDLAAGESNTAGVAFDTEVPTWVAIHLGHGDATFDPAMKFPVAGTNSDYSGGEPHIAVGDLNGDGKKDIVSVAGASGVVTVLLDSTPASPAAPSPPGSGPPLGAPSSPGAPDITAPVLSALSLTRRTFAVGSAFTALTAARTKRGTTVRYTLSESARVTLAIARLDSGRRSGKRCVKPTRKLRHAKRCTLRTPEGTLARAGSVGANAIAFSGRIEARELAPGDYQMKLVATDPAKNRSTPHRLAFTIVLP